MKFPVVKKGTSEYPNKPKCPWCKKKKVFEPHSMAVLCGGAMVGEGKRARSGIADNLDGFLSIIWHGAHDGGIGKGRDIYTRVDLAMDTLNGQFEAYFCSTSCLRKFLSHWVDSLDDKIKKETRKKRRTSKSHISKNPS